MSASRSGGTLCRVIAHFESLRSSSGILGDQTVDVMDTGVDIPPGPPGPNDLVPEPNTPCRLRKKTVKLLSPSAGGSDQGADRESGIASESQ